MTTSEILTAKSHSYETDNLMELILNNFEPNRISVMYKEWKWIQGVGNRVEN